MLVNKFRNSALVALLLTTGVAFAQVPSGFYVISRQGGVTVYKKDYPGGQPDFVTIAKLDSGATVSSLTGKSGGPPYYVFQKLPFEDFVGRAINASTSQRYVQSVFNGTYFQNVVPGFLTELSFGLKSNGQVLSYGVEKRINEVYDVVRTLCYDTSTSGLFTYSRQTFDATRWPNVIGAYSMHAFQDDHLYIPRNMFGLRDGDGNGTLETIVFFFTKYARKWDAIGVLREFGCGDNTIGILDAGASSGFWTNGVYVSAPDPFWRPIPHAISVFASPPLNAAKFVADVNYPDGTIVAPGQTFTKVWRIRNTGNTVWGGNNNPSDGYHWTFDGGSQMNGPSQINAPPKNPGQNWEPAVALRAPTTPGTYRGYWRMTSPSGAKFGDRCWVEIRVVSSDIVYVHDTGAGFTKYGPSQYWWRDNGAGLDGFWYTYSNGSSVSNYARWRPTIPSTGRYRVEVMVPERHATTRSAQYEVNHANGRTVVPVNQSLYFREWVSLGVFDFNAGTGGYIQLTDVTGEPLGWFSIGFDAIRFVPV